MNPTSVTAGQGGRDPAASRRPWWVGIGLALVFMLIATLVAAWWLTRPEEERSPGLEALRADPMATASIPGLVQTDESSNPGHSAEEGFMGKGANARLTRVVRVPAGDLAAAVESVRQVAERHDWKTKSFDLENHSYRAQRQLKVSGSGLVLAQLSASFDTVALPGSQGTITLTMEAE